VIRLTNIRKVYPMGGGEVAALAGVSLHIRAGEFVAIVGPSGSGKSTLMHIMGCLDRATSGAYALDGLPVSDLPGRALADIRNRKIGFVFQGFQLLPRLTALENVELPLTLRGADRKARRDAAEQALARVGLAERMEHRPMQLSGGQRQRVAIARALVGQPPVILADEPTGNLDAQASGEVMALLQALHGQGSTVVLITHDAAVARRAARRVLVRDGRIQEG
jgi:putative ABC transport system ATP-binding protein